ncbi:tyrosine-type recombinase/integrase [Candidatus Methanocrinis natronophilus]|uniref:Tyrosine-type recombinase/integrase n=1 Tax=Candidatus Methanocrinis natronophilus TaxID=3033396 RepID=A0ABT5X4Z3_9EURY|nr:tyrosine-type recombinase/integrase [Candidatus Methanocrinis natronophilus]MDF0589770.1 tyrosine-type recombinase/integrase [Candidatus Methanocrinis natronophilus]
MVPKLITPTEFKALVDSLEGRDRLIIKLLAGTGMRISELTRLKKSDLDLDDRLIRPQAHKTKTRKYRDVVIPAPLVPELKRWVKSFDHSDYVFPGQGISAPMTSSRVRQIVHEGAVEAGVQRAYGRDKDGKPLYVVTPHTLRHFHAVRALDLGIPLNDLQAQLGHTDLKTTSVYLKADINHRRKSYEGFEI